MISHTLQKYIIKQLFKRDGTTIMIYDYKNL